MQALLKIGAHALGDEIGALLHARAVIVASDPAQSRLYKVVTHEAEPAMPPGKKLTDDEIETLRIWIEAGAIYPKVDAKEADAAAKASNCSSRETGSFARGRLRRAALGSTRS